MSTAGDRWTLISVLFSSIPLSASLAATLHEVALGLYRDGGAMSPVAGDLVNGRVVNLRKSVTLGSIAGPAFEASLETERGKGTVRYLLTRQGLELQGLAVPPPARGPGRALPN